MTPLRTSLLAPVLAALLFVSGGCSSWAMSMLYDPTTGKRGKRPETWKQTVERMSKASPRGSISIPQILFFALEATVLMPVDLFFLVLFAPFDGLCILINGHPLLSQTYCCFWYVLCSTRKFKDPFETGKPNPVPLAGTG